LVIFIEGKFRIFSCPKKEKRVLAVGKKAKAIHASFVLGKI
jgi:hypothetical protein